jgi:CRISPR system Cascade subunit CasA
MNFFNLLDEPWIPVVYEDGEHSEVGFRQLLTHSTRIVDVVLDPPTAYAAVLRLAVALLMRTHGAPLAASATDWEQWRASLLQHGPNLDTIDSYLAEQHKSFFLRGERPFLQEATLSVEAPSISSPNKLRFDHASGNNPLFWTKTPDAAAPALDPKTAAIWLLVQWFYAAGGRCNTNRHKPSRCGSTSVTHPIFRRRSDLVANARSKFYPKPRRRRTGKT